MNDQKNRFAKNDVARQARRVETSKAAVAGHQAHLAENLATWHGSRRTDNRVGSLLLDELTAQAKRAADQVIESRRKDGPAAPQQLSLASIAAITTQWVKWHPEFYDSEFNAASMTAFVRKNVDAGVPFGMEILDAGFTWLSNNDHLERDPSIPRKRGEVTSQAAPVPFEYVSAEEREARQQVARQVAQSIEDGEQRRAKNMPLDDLQKEVRGSRKPLTRQQASAVVL
jgi:hypothetical protein